MRTDARAADQRNIDLVRSRMLAMGRQSGPRVGDWIEFVDGTYGRFTHDYGRDIQTTVRGGKFGLGSFYLGDYGCSYSGALDPAIPKASLEAVDGERQGWVWIFDRDFPGAGRGVDFQVWFRVFREVAK